MSRHDMTGWATDFVANVSMILGLTVLALLIFGLAWLVYYGVL